jgi:hypothetical protein
MQQATQTVRDPIAALRSAGAGLGQAWRDPQPSGGD